MSLFSFFKRKKCQSCLKSFPELYNYVPIDYNAKQSKDPSSILQLCKDCLDKKHDAGLADFGKKIKSTFSSKDDPATGSSDKKIELG